MFIVGIGHYPYLAGGGPGEDPTATLGQLSSPPASARALADWFIKSYHYPPAPLGSVALLLSERPQKVYTPPNGRALLTPRPDYSAFETAAQSWFVRGNASEGSRTIFIFFGHGFGYGTETSLLMADFDFRKLNLWDFALDLGDFHAGMDGCAAAEQLFLIDACRRPHPSSVSPHAATGRSPVHPGGPSRKDRSLKRRNAPIFFSTGDDQPARGRVGGISVFAEAFLHAVEGMAARDDTGTWQVNNFSLLEAMDHVSKRLTNTGFPEPQQPQGTEARRFDFHYLRGDPISPVYISRSGQPCGPGVLAYDLKGKSQNQPCSGSDIEIELRLPYGPYEFKLRQGSKVVASARARSAPTFKKADLC